MNQEKNFFMLFSNMFEIFKAQNPENDHFDVIFVIGGKKLHANKLILGTVSTTFKSMLSDRWNKTDEAITITEYCFDDFKELFTFIYSGGCLLTNGNIFSMVDLAEFYGIDVLKDFCEEFLVQMDLNLDNGFKMLELSIKYSLTQFKQYVHKYISNDLSDFLQSVQFIDLKKSAVKEIVEFNQETARQKELFEMVYKWAENQAKEKQNSDEALDLNTVIKEELFDILPFFKFKKMDYLFFIQFVVEKSFLFSGAELSNILRARTKIYVKIIDGNGKKMKGELERDNSENVAAVIQSTKDNFCEMYYQYFYWATRQTKPSTPSKLIENNNVEWYLIYDKDGDIAIKHRNQLCTNDYLLGEMFAENGFELSKQCKIEVFYFV